MTLLRDNTPLEDHLATLGLIVKREDLACAPPGPPFSKTRGVFAHVRARYDEGVRTFGVLDTGHSQAGHAVAAVCRELGDPAVRCLNYFPVYKAELRFPPGGVTEDEAARLVVASVRPAQMRALELGAVLRPLPAGRSAVLYHTARRRVEAEGGYMMPNALKLPETVAETAAEVRRTLRGANHKLACWMRRVPWLIACSSGTIAAGVMRGVLEEWGGSGEHPRLLLHMGYDRSEDALHDHVYSMAGDPASRQVATTLVNEGYAYADRARPGGEELPFPANDFYDRKCVAWWNREGRATYGEALLWLIG